MRRLRRLVLVALSILTLLPLSAALPGCGQDEAQSIREENFNPEVENAMRNYGIAREKQEELEEERAAQEAQQ